MTASYTCLPLEVHQMIFSLLPLGSFAALRLVSKTVKEVVENDKFWLQQIRTCFGTRPLEIFQDYTPLSAFVALCHVKPFIFNADRGSIIWAVEDDIDDYEKQAEAEHSLTWHGPTPWRTRWSHTLDKRLDEIESFVDIHTSQALVYALSNKENMSVRQIDNPEDAVERPYIVGVKYKMLSSSPYNYAGLADRNEIIEWNTDDNMYRDQGGELQLPNRVPHRMAALKGLKIKQVDAGTGITACLTECNQVFFWDFRWPSFTRRIQETFSLDYIIQLPSLNAKIVEIATGDQFVIALTDDHAVYLCRIPMTKEHQSFAEEYSSRYPETLMEDYVGKDNQWQERTSAKMMPAYQSYLQENVRSTIQWIKLDRFCDNKEASGLQPDGTDLWQQEAYSHLMSKAPEIKHVYASRDCFMVVDPDAGSDLTSNERKGIALIGKVDDVESAIVLPELQGGQVIKMSRENYTDKYIWSAQTRKGGVFLWQERIKRREWHYDRQTRVLTKLPLEPEANWHYTKRMEKPRLVRFQMNDGFSLERGVLHRDPFVIDIASANRSCAMAVLTVDKHWLKAKERGEKS